MIASLNADILKTRKRNANWILIGILLAFVVLLSYVVGYVIFKHPPPNFRSEVPASVLLRETFPENLVPNVLGGISSIGAAIVLIMGALSTASEYGWMTVQTILVQLPTRRAVLGGKILALALASLLVTLSVFLAAGVTSFILITIDGSASHWPSVSVLLRGLAAAWLILGVYTAFGMVLGVVFRSTAAAIGGGLTYVFVVEGLLAALLANTEGVKEILKLLPGVAATGVARAFPFTFARLNQGPALVDATRGSITLLMYLVVFVVIGLAVFERRDVGA